MGIKVRLCILFRGRRGGVDRRMHDGDEQSRDFLPIKDIF
jgi:hypothetical protein